METESSTSVLVYTPMFHARLFAAENAKYREHHFEPTRTGLTAVASANANAGPSDLYLDGNPAFDRPLFVQFCANEPDELLKAAKSVQAYCDAVDLNLGCPQGIARKGKYGAFLQEDWDLIYRLINTLHTNLDIPVTAKIRILETKEKTLEYAKMILSAGASILTVHGRQRDQKGHKTGLADWSVIRYLRESLPPETVLFANGNILRHEDINRCLERTGADGVMSAEGNLHDPTIFAKPPTRGAEGREYWRGRDGRGGYRMDAVLRRYMDIIYKHVLNISPPKRQALFLPSDPVAPDVIPKEEEEEMGASQQPPAKRQKRDSKYAKSTSPNLVSMQSHFFSLLRPLVPVHTHIRDALASSRPGDIEAFEKVLQMVEKATKEGFLDYEAHPERHEDVQDETENTDEVEIADQESSATAIRACKRPWWVCQPYVRPLPKEALEKGALKLSKKELEKKNVEVACTLETSSEAGSRLSVRGLQDLKDGLELSEIAHQAIVAG
jgi:tRNA-dihydrouridine synthase 1